jgi:hypothetical protein
MAQGHRVDEILQQIAHLEPEEQRQLLERLPAVLLCSAEELGWLQVAEPAFGFWDNLKMHAMTSYNRGDVVLVPFPFTDLTLNVKDQLLCSAVIASIRVVWEAITMILGCHLSISGGLSKPSPARKRSILTRCRFFLITPAAGR